MNKIFLGDREKEVKDKLNNVLKKASLKFNYLENINASPFPTFNVVDQDLQPIKERFEFLYVDPLTIKLKIVIYLRLIHSVLYHFFMKQPKKKKDFLYFRI